MKTKLFNKCISFFLAIIFVIGIAMPETKAQTDKNLTGNVVFSEWGIYHFNTGKILDKIVKTETTEKVTVSLKGKFDLSNLGATIKAGDFFEVQFPENLLIVDKSYPMLNPETGEEWGTMSMDQDSKKATFTFNENVEWKNHVKGSFYVKSELNVKNIAERITIVFPGGFEQRIEFIPPYDGVPIEDEKIYKSAWGSSTSQYLSWIIRINRTGSKLGNSKVVIKDAINTDEGAYSTYVRDSFKLREGVYTERVNSRTRFNITKEIPITTDEVEFNANPEGKALLKLKNTSFELEIGGDKGSKSYQLFYNTTSRGDGTIVKNGGWMEVDGKPQIAFTKINNKEYNKVVHNAAAFAVKFAGADVTGDSTGRIIISKFDKNEGELLEGAEFKLTKENDPAFMEILVTEEDGVAISPPLNIGIYYLEETKAPNGYHILKEKIRVEVVEDVDGIIKPIPVNIPNIKKIIDIKAKKFWSDSPEGFEAKFGLFYYLEGETVTDIKPVQDAPEPIVKKISEFNYEYTWKNLPTKNAEGKFITYVVRELNKENKPLNDGEKIGLFEVKYDDAKHEITNTVTGQEYINIEGKKVWKGKNLEVTIELFRKFKNLDGNIVTEKLYTRLFNQVTGWDFKFEQLEKYNNLTGEEYQYYVEEKPINGYVTKYSKDDTGKIIITNIEIEKVNIPVIKFWEGPKLDSVEVVLLANGLETGKKVILSEDNNWTDEFMDLPKIDQDANPIEYMIKEIKHKNYDVVIEGSEEKGFTIKNINNEVVSVGVKKVWFGPKLNSVIVKLFADEVELKDKQIELNEKNNWSHIFENLPKYSKDGKELKYTVKEEVNDKYDTKIEGNMNLGFLITNTNIEKISIPVEKKWVGKVLEKVEIILLKNGEESGKLVLTADTNWKGVFENLPKYDEKGNEIYYNIRETKVGGYDTEIKGDQNRGFVVTNKEVPESPKTGDTMNIFFPIIAILTSLSALLFVSKKRIIKK